MVIRPWLLLGSSQAKMLKKRNLTENHSRKVWTWARESKSHSFLDSQCIILKTSEFLIKSNSDVFAKNYSVPGQHRCLQEGIILQEENSNRMGLGLWSRASQLVEMANDKGRSEYTVIYFSGSLEGKKYNQHLHFLRSNKMELKLKLIWYLYKRVTL